MPPPDTAPLPVATPPVTPIHTVRVWLAERPGLVIFAAALCVRVAWVLTLSHSLAWPDEEEFVEIARHLTNGDGFVSSSYRAAPGYPLYLGLVFSVVGESYLAARIGQAIFGALTCLLIYWTAARLINRRVGMLSGALLALYLPHIFLSGVFYVECLYILLASLSLYLIVRGLQQGPTVAAAVLCGISCGATILTRPIFAAYIPFLCLTWLYSCWPAWRNQIWMCAALLAATAATIIPWSVRNYSVFHRVIPVSSGFYTTLWQGNNVLALGDANDRVTYWYSPAWVERMQRLEAPERMLVAKQYAEVDSLVRELLRKRPDQYLATDAALKPIIQEYIVSHPGRLVPLFAKKLLTLFSAFTPTDTSNSFTSRRNRLLAAVTYYPMLALALVGAWLGLREGRALSVIYLYVVAIACAYALLTACTRFRLPLDPYLIMFAALAVVRAFERKSQKSKGKSQE